MNFAKERESIIMYRGLVNTLTYMYRFVAMGRGRLKKDELEKLAGSAGLMATKAPQVLADEFATLTEDDRQALSQAVLVDQHIDEMVKWLIDLEIV